MKNHSNSYKIKALNNKIATFKSQSNINSANLSYYKNLSLSSKQQGDTSGKQRSSKDFQNLNLFKKPSKDTQNQGKYSRYNSADKYKLYNNGINNKYNNSNNLSAKMNKFDDIVRKSNNIKQVGLKNPQEAIYFPHQINININNYNFSNYNSKSSYNKFRQSQGNAYSSNHQPQVDSFQYNSNLIKNSGNSPAYIEIISPLNVKSEDNNTNQFYFDNSSQLNNANINNYVSNNDTNSNSNIGLPIPAQNAGKNRNISTRQGFTADQLSNNRLQNRLNLNNQNIMLINNPNSTTTDKPGLQSMMSPALMQPPIIVNQKNNYNQQSLKPSYIPTVGGISNSQSINTSNKIIINKSVQKKVKEINSNKTETTPSIKTSTNNLDESLPQIKNSKIHVSSAIAIILI
jgi:hypothetical protein